MSKTLPHISPLDFTLREELLSYLSDEESQKLLDFMFAFARILNGHERYIYGPDYFVVSIDGSMTPIKMKKLGKLFKELKLESYDFGDVLYYFRATKEGTALIRIEDGLHVVAVFTFKGELRWGE